MKITSMCHCGVTVKNLEKALEFYHGVLGLEIVSPPCPWVLDKEESKALGAPECIHRICSLKTPDGQIVELMDYKDVESPHAESAPVYQVGQHHFSFFVEDFNGAVKELQDYGCEIIYHPLPYEDEMWVLAKDPDGIIFELMGMAQ